MPATVERLRRAWLDAGPNPAVHSAAKSRLRDSWPTLYNAIEELVTACPRCGGPDDHGDECVTELERKRIGGERLIDALRRTTPHVRTIYGESRDASIAQTHLDTAMLWLEKGIASGAIRLPE